MPSKKRKPRPEAALAANEQFLGLLQGLIENMEDWPLYLVTADYCADHECYDLAIAFRWMYTQKRYPRSIVKDGAICFQWSRYSSCDHHYVCGLGTFDGSWKVHPTYLDAILTIAGQLKRRRAKFCVVGDVGCFKQVDEKRRR